MHARDVLIIVNLIGFVYYRSKLVFGLRAMKTHESRQKSLGEYAFIKLNARCYLPWKFTKY